MPSNAFRRSVEEQSAANSEALRGAVVGAAKFGLITFALGLAGTFLSPIYRNLTIQFKVYIQLSGMTLGGWIEADRRLRSYEFRALSQRRREKLREDERVWQKWERLVEEEEEGKAKKARETQGR
ncbi:MAG: hypothetical protein Q9218_001570 [Villophora microphyllina]